MKVVIPIAGLGSRFLKVGITTPKPLISVLGKPMIQRAVESIPFVNNKDIIFIVRKDHVDKYHIITKLKELFGKKVGIIITDSVTEGAACTVLLAKGLINNQEDLLIIDSDHYFKCDLPSLVKTKDEDIKGIVFVFENDDPKWSFTKVDDSGYVVEIAEKRPISKYANVGAYYFSCGSDFVWAAEKMISEDKKVNGEFYVAPVYNEMLTRGDKIIISQVEYMWEMGTPQDLDFFVKNFPEKHPKVV